MVDADLLAISLADLSTRQAGALSPIVIAAWEGLADRMAAAPGKTVLVQARAGWAMRWKTMSPG